MTTRIAYTTIRSVFVILVLGLGLFATTGPAGAGHPSGVINDTWDGVAIKGYDPVAYFTMGQAVKGSDEFTHEWLETRWLFASAIHRDLFAASPLTYVPQYGGYCSEATYVADKADVNPTAWRVVNNRLYLFYSEPGAEKWASDEYEVKQADAAWEHVKAGLTQ